MIALSDCLLVVFSLKCAHLTPTTSASLSSQVEYAELPWIEAQVQLVACLKETALAARGLNNGQAVKAGTRGKDGTTIFEVLDAAMRG